MNIGDKYGCRGRDCKKAEECLRKLAHDKGQDVQYFDDDRDACIDCGHEYFWQVER